VSGQFRHMIDGGVIVIIDGELKVVVDVIVVVVGYGPESCQ